MFFFQFPNFSFFSDIEEEKINAVYSEFHGFVALEAEL